MDLVFRLLLQLHLDLLVLSVPLVLEVRLHQEDLAVLVVLVVLGRLKKKKFFYFLVEKIRQITFLI